MSTNFFALPKLDWIGKTYPHYPEKIDENAQPPPTDLWSAPQPVKTAIWKPWLDRVNRPLDWVLDSTFDWACRKVHFLEFARSNNQKQFIYHVHDWCINVMFESDAELMMRRKLGMSPSKLRSILDILQWTRDNLVARNQACIEQLNHLDHRLTPSPLAKPRPVWRVDAVVASHLDWARRWAERADQNLPLAQQHSFTALTCSQLDDLLIGLKIAESLREIKILERASINYISELNKSRTWIKTAFIGPALLMIALPKRLPWQIALPFIGVACLIRAAHLFHWARIDFSHTLENRAKFHKYYMDLAFLILDAYLIQRDREMEREDRNKQSEEATLSKACQRAEEAEERVLQLQEEVKQVRNQLNRLLRQFGGESIG